MKIITIGLAPEFSEPECLRILTRYNKASVLRHSKIDKIKKFKWFISYHQPSVTDTVMFSKKQGTKKKPVLAFVPRYLFFIIYFLIFFLSLSS